MKTHPALLLVVTLLTAGCMGFNAECAGAQAAQGQSGVCNATDHFAYGGQLSGHTATVQETWENTKGGAEVQWGGQVSSGSFTLTLTDAAGKQVYAQRFSSTTQGGSGTSAQTGEPGDWTVRIEFDQFTGQMGLTLRAE